jgi:CPA2 family monovalent cation:H+ antiporter-2
VTDGHHFLRDLATVLGVAAVTTVAFQMLRWPVVLGYLLAGLVVGPHVPIPLVADLGTVQTLSELGLILLLFSVGLEFRIGKLLRVAPNAGLVGLVEVGLMLFLGATCARLLGWSGQEQVYAGGVVAISSTTIVVKAFDAQRVGGRQRELVLGVLVVEDLIAILLLAGLTAWSAGGGLSGRELLTAVGRLLGFLLLLITVGLLTVPRLFRAVVRLGQPETTLVAAVGFCFTIALLAQAAGYSVALGAFVAGMLVAESGREQEIEHLVRPVRDLFAAIFFVSVGMLIDPRLIARSWLPIAVFTPLVLCGKIAAVGVGAFLAGNSVRSSVMAGFSLAQIGEFSFILAGLGRAVGAVGEQLYPVAVAVAAITALTTPSLVRAAGPVSDWVDRRLPRPLQTFAALYGSWVERLRASRGAGQRSRVRRAVRLLLLDATSLLGLVFLSSLAGPSAAGWMQAQLGVGPRVTGWLLPVAGFALALPLLWGLLRVSRQLAGLLSNEAFPAPPGGATDPAAAPRRVLAVALHAGLLLLVGVPVLPITAPFLPPLSGALALTSLLALSLSGLWRSAADLQGHLRAGALVVVEVIAAQGASAAREDQAAGHALLEQVHSLLPGLGEPEPATIGAGSRAAGKTLRELNLRGRTGATVLGIARGEEQLILPDGAERLLEGDLLALAGSSEAISAAREELSGGASGSGVAP